MLLSWEKPCCGGAPSDQVAMCYWSAAGRKGYGLVGNGEALSTLSGLAERSSKPRLDSAGPSKKGGTKRLYKVSWRPRGATRRFPKTAAPWRSCPLVNNLCRRRRRKGQARASAPNRCESATLTWGATATQGAAAMGEGRPARGVRHALACRARAEEATQVAGDERLQQARQRQDEELARRIEAGDGRPDAPRERSEAADHNEDVGDREVFPPSPPAERPRASFRGRVAAPR